MLHDKVTNVLHPYFLETFHEIDVLVVRYECESSGTRSGR